MGTSVAFTRIAYVTSRAPRVIFAGRFTTAITPGPPDAARRRAYASAVSAVSAGMRNASTRGATHDGSDAHGGTQNRARNTPGGSNSGEVRVTPPARGVTNRSAHDLGSPRHRSRSSTAATAPRSITTADASAARCMKLGFESRSAPASVPVPTVRFGASKPFGSWVNAFDEGWTASTSPHARSSAAARATARASSELEGE